MRISVFGSGYVGLVTGACFAEAGNSVLCVDVNPDVIRQLNAGDIPIFEPGLKDLVTRNREAGRLSFTTSAEQGVREGEFLFIAVGTPADEDGSADITYVLNVAGDIARYMDDAKVVVVKSTVPVGTVDRVSSVIGGVLAERGESLDFDVVSNPEFLKEGAAIADFMKPDRVIVGTRSTAVGERMRQMYAPFVKNHDVVIVTDVASSELIKYAANAMLATKISFMNEIANIAERVGADVEEVRVGIGSDPRIGFDFIYPGAGYGGSCFPKDVRALARTAQEHGYRARILESVEAVNDDQKTVLFEKLRRHFRDDLEGRTIAVWGLAFKPNTDDMRDAPSRALIDALLEAGAKVQAHDPQALNEAKRLYADRVGVAFYERRDDALDDADALVVVTEWKNFWSPDFQSVRERLRQPVLVDGRNIYDPATLAREGFTYYSIGRPCPADRGDANAR